MYSAHHPQQKSWRKNHNKDTLRVPIRASKRRGREERKKKKREKKERYLHHRSPPPSHSPLFRDRGRQGMRFSIRNTNHQTTSLTPKDTSGTSTFPTPFTARDNTHTHSLTHTMADLSWGVGCWERGQFVCSSIIHWPLIDQLYLVDFSESLPSLFFRAGGWWKMQPHPRGRTT